MPCVRDFCHHWFRQWLGTKSVMTSCQESSQEHTGEILIKMIIFLFKKMSSVNWRLFCWGLNLLNPVHYSDVIMDVMVSQITGISIVSSTVCPGADQRNHKKNIKAPRHWPLLGKTTGHSTSVTVGFPSQRASNAEIVSIWWRHHVYLLAWFVANVLFHPVT